MTAAAEHPEGTVYMLHFDQPYKHARHYTGWASDLAARLAEHAAGRGARLTQVVKEAGISWQLARTWPGSRATERDIKDRRNTPAMCPVCSPHPWPGTGHRKSPADLAARREAAAFLAGARAAEKWAGPVLAAGQLDEARQMLAVNPVALDRVDAERQRGFTAQLAAMIRTADTGPDWARETEMEAGDPPAGKGSTLDTTEYDAGQDPESDGLDGLAGIAAARAFAAHLETGTPEYDADGNPSAEADADAAQHEPEPESAHQGLPPTGVYGSGMDQYVRDEAELGSRAAAALDEADYDPLAFVYDHHYAADTKAEAERDQAHRGGGDSVPVHDPGSWLARDGDTVREVAADGTPGPEASPDDGRPVAETESDAGQAYVDDAGLESAAYWGGEGPAWEAQAEATAAEPAPGTGPHDVPWWDGERMASDRDRTPERVAEMEAEAG